MDIKNKLRSGKAVLGTWNLIPSSSLMNVIAKSGVDFVVIDREHGPTSMTQAEDLIRAAENCGVAPLIRVTSNDSGLILRALDIGAHGVQVPHISTKQDAELAVQSAKYHPQGERGYSPFTRAGEYGLRAKVHAKSANDETLIVLNVEGVEGIKNLKAIASVKNIDVVFIGPYDLSQSLGKPGQVKDAEVVKMIKESVKVIKDQGVACGSFAGDEEYLDILLKAGVQYITYGVDTAIIRNAYADVAALFQGKIKK